MTDDDRQRRLPRVEKDVDDPTRPPVASPNIEESTSTTFTTLTRLLGTSPSSAETSRRSSYLTQRQSRPHNVRETAALPDHLYLQGLQQGKHSDITVYAFNNEYKLHRIILDRSPYFSTLLGGPWREAGTSDLSIQPEDIDSNITQHGFELALKRLYKGNIVGEEDDEYAVELLAIGCFLELPELVDSAVESILRRMDTINIGYLISVVTKSYYGRAGEKILASAKAMLCRDGWQMPQRDWDSITADVVFEIISSDGFFVEDEYERWRLAHKIFTHRMTQLARTLNIDATLNLSSADVRLLSLARTTQDARSPSHLAQHVAVYHNDSISPLLVLLDSGIHYVHLDFEQLQHIRTTRDIFDVPVVDDRVLTDAFWLQTELRQRVQRAAENDLELGLANRADQDINQINTLRLSTLHDTRFLDHRHWIPSADCNIVMGGSTEPVISISPSSEQYRDESYQTTEASDRVRRASLERSSTSTSYYTQFPPFRFSAEFPPPRSLKEKKRVYSRTVCYAGSRWNIYIQKVASTRSTKQLGVYLHRAKEIKEETIYTGSGIKSGHSTVGRAFGALETAMLRRGTRRSGLDEDEVVVDSDTPLDSYRSRLIRPSNSTGRPPAANTLLDARLELTSDESENDEHNKGSSKSGNMLTIPPYIDQRPTIKTYFKIFSPSRGGRMLSVYESAPDKFNFSQSWGWKSSTLMLDEGLFSSDTQDTLADVVEEGDDGVVDDHHDLSGLFSKEEGSARPSARSLREGKLRFMVVIGVI